MTFSVAKRNLACFGLEPNKETRDRVCWSAQALQMWPLWTVYCLHNVCARKRIHCDNVLLQVISKQDASVLAQHVLRFLGREIRACVLCPTVQLSAPSRLGRDTLRCLLVQIGHLVEVIVEMFINNDFTGNLVRVGSNTAVQDPAELRPSSMVLQCMRDKVYHHQHHHHFTLCSTMHF